MPVYEFPFNGGVDETADRILAPDDRVRVMNNCRLARDGRVEVRRGHTALSMLDTFGFTVVPRDLFTFRDRLLVSDESQSRLRTYLPGYTPGAWTFGAGIRELPAFCDFEKLLDIPYGAKPRSWDVAAFVDAGVRFVAVTYTDEVANVAYLRILRDGVEVLFTFETSVTSDARVIATGTTFRWLYVTTSIQHKSISPVASLTVSGATGVSGGQAPSFAWGAAVEVGGTNWAIAYPQSGGTMIWRSYTGTTQIATNNQAVQRPCNIAYVNNTIVLVWTASSALLGRSYNATTNASISGAQTLVAAGSMAGQPTIVATSSTEVVAAAVNAAAVGEADFTMNFTRPTPVATMVPPSVTALISQWWHSNLFTYPDALSGPGVGALGYVFSADISVGGSTIFAGTGALLGKNSGSTNQFRVEATINRGFTPRFFSGVEEAGAPSVATDGEWFYGLLPTQTGEHVGLNTEVDGLQLYRWRAVTQSDTRLQSVEACGALYGAGSAPWMFAGTRTVDLGFADAPRVLTITQSTGGSMTLLGTYNYVACYVYTDEIGQLHRSQPSSPFAVTLTGSNNNATVKVTSPHSAKAFGSACGIELYRTLNNDSTMFLAQTLPSPVNAWESVDFTSGEADSTIITSPVLYTQSQTPDAHFPPPPCKYIAAGRDRLIWGGLPDPFIVQLSKLPFPNEPLQSGSPNSFKYQARLHEPVTAVAAMNDTYLVFTADAIYEIPGNGPQRNGQGEFDYPRELYSDGGCINHQSLCHCAKGLWFQEAPDKLSLFDGASVTWAGQPIRDTLASYPNIRGAVLCTDTQTVVFACVNDANNDGVLLNYDLRREIWTIDPVGAAQAVIEYDGRLAYILSSTVRLEDPSVGSGAMPTMSVRTASIRLFSAQGRGNLFRIGLLGTYRGDCSVQAYISYDDGLNWTLLGAAQSITSADYAVDAPVDLQFDPPTHDVTRFALRFDVSGGTNTGAIRLHAFSLEVESEDFLGRRPARDMR